MDHSCGSSWSRYNHKGLQSVDKFKLEQGQGEKFIAILSPMDWSKGTRGGDCNGYTLKL